MFTEEQNAKEILEVITDTPQGRMSECTGELVVGEVSKEILGSRRRSLRRSEAFHHERISERTGRLIVDALGQQVVKVNFEQFREIPQQSASRSAHGKEILEGIVDTAQACIRQRIKDQIVDVAVPRLMEKRGIDPDRAVSQNPKEFLTSFL